MLLELSPLVAKQARRLCRDVPQLTDDAYAEGCIRLWELLEQGIEEVPYLLTATRNRIRNFLRDERRISRPDLCCGADDEEDREGLLERIADPTPYDPVEWLAARDALTSLSSPVRRAIVKRAFRHEPLNGAERIALHRLRKELASGSRRTPSGLAHIAEHVQHGPAPRPEISVLV